MPTLVTPRLRITELVETDIASVHQLLDQDSQGTLEDRRRWLEWTILSYTQLAELHQPPYGERAIVESTTDQLVGLCGFAPLLGPFRERTLYTPEVGLYWAVASTRRREGIASEAARAMVDYAFDALRLGRVLATTSFDNAASIGVMRKLGMRIERNPYPEPEWFQVIGVLDARAWLSLEASTGGP